MENNNFAGRLPGVDNVTKKKDARLKYGPGSPNFYRNMREMAMAQRSKAPKSRHQVKVVTIESIRFRFKKRLSKPKKPMFKKDVENVTGSEDKKKTEDAPLKDVVSFRNRRKIAMALRSKVPKSRHPVKVVAIESFPFRFKKRILKDVEKSTDSETSEDEEWDYHLAKKKWEDAHLKEAVFSDVCETKQPCGGLDSPHSPQLTKLL